MEPDLCLIGECYEEATVCQKHYDALAARLAEASKAIRIYGGHIPPCQGRPCECGFVDVWRTASETVSGVNDGR
jgi:hypothetical protein